LGISLTGWVLGPGIPRLRMPGFQGESATMSRYTMALSPELIEERNRRRVIIFAFIKVWFEHIVYPSPWQFARQPDFREVPPCRLDERML
jgi:hypothetical protein